MNLPLFRTAYITNISASAKKGAAISVRLMHAKEDLFYVRKVQSTTEVIGYRDPKTNLFVTKLRPDDTTSNLTHNMFRELALEYAQQQVNQKLVELSEIANNNKTDYETKYKPLKTIERELSEYLADKHDFFIDLDKQVAVIKSNPKPQTNEYLVYSDDKITDDMFTTTRLDYQNPSKQTLTEEQANIVDSFLDVFVDSYNKRVLSWYFGAMLCNLPIYDERISKMLIVSSAHGGSGKNTLINALTQSLLTDDYREIKSSFDPFFMVNNRFGTSQILPLRLIQYSEAEFNDMPKGEHNFDGLNISELKSMISEGYIASEKKYADMQTTRLSSFNIVLTNHPPVIDEDRSALNRRLLGLIVNPTTMAEKGELLQLDSEQKVYQYVLDNVQAFANYFVAMFKADEKAFTTLEYNYNEMQDDIISGETQRQKDISLDHKQLSELQSYDIANVLGEISRRKNLNIDKLVLEIWNEKQKPTHDDIRWDNDVLYLNSTKEFFLKYGALLPMRNVLKSIYGEPVKKFGHRMYRLKVVKNEDN